MLLDAFVLAVAAGSIALWYERLRMRDIFEKLIVVREMNHHVRNALQVVTLQRLHTTRTLQKWFLMLWHGSSGH